MTATSFTFHAWDAPPQQLRLVGWRKDNRALLLLDAHGGRLVLTLDPLRDCNPDDFVPESVRRTDLVLPTCCATVHEADTVEKPLYATASDWPALKKALRQALDSRAAALSKLQPEDVGALGRDADASSSPEEKELRAWAKKHVEAARAATRIRSWKELVQEAHRLLVEAFQVVGPGNHSAAELQRQIVWDTSFAQVQAATGLVREAVNDFLLSRWAAEQGWNHRQLIQDGKRLCFDVIGISYDEPGNAYRCAQLLASARYVLVFRNGKKLWLRDASVRQPIHDDEQQQFNSACREHPGPIRLSPEKAEEELGLTEDPKHRTLKKYCQQVGCNYQNLTKDDLPALRAVQTSSKRSQAEGIRIVNRERKKLSE